MKDTKIASLVILLCVLLMLAVGLFFLKPKVADIKNTKIEIGVKSKEADNLKQKVNALKELEQQMAQKTEDLKLLDLAAPTIPAIPDLLVTVENIANNSGMKVTAIQPGEAVEAGIPINLTAQGNFDSLQKYTEALGLNLRPLLVKTISVSASEDPQSKEMILANTYRMSMLYVGKAQITAIAPAKATSPAK